MAHVQIRPNPDGAYHVIVDGHDIAMSVLLWGFSITPSEQGTGWHVTMTVHADTLEADLPDSVVVAERAEREEA